MFMKEKIEELLNDCIAYKYDKNNLIHKNLSFSNDEHLLYKELVLITTLLDSLEIKYKIDTNNNILLSF